MSRITQWFPNTIKPVNIGMYKVKSIFDRRKSYFSYWNGYTFGYAMLKNSEAMKHKDKPSICQYREWRGLAEKPE
jgi:hypothetical protein